MVGLGPRWNSDFSVVLRLMPWVVMARVLEASRRRWAKCGRCAGELPWRVEEKPEKGQGGVEDDWLESLVRERDEK